MKCIFAAFLRDMTAKLSSQDKKYFLMITNYYSFKGGMEKKKEI